MSEGTSSVHRGARTLGFLALILAVLALPSAAVILLKPDARITRLQKQIRAAEDDFAVAGAVERKRSQFLEQVDELRNEAERHHQGFFLEGDANLPTRDGRDDPNIRAWFESALGRELSGDGVIITRELWRGEGKGPAGEGSFEFAGFESKVVLPALTSREVEGVQRSLEAGVESWLAVPIREVEITRGDDGRYKVETTLLMRVRYPFH